MSAVRKGKTVNFGVRKVGSSGISNTFDEVVTEEPLEIRIYQRTSDGNEKHESVSITMRTPGNDFELAAGFLFAEGIISKTEDIERISYCVNVEEDQQFNVVNVYLSPWVKFDRETLSRNFYVSSSCGVCGKASLEALRLKGCVVIKEDKVLLKEKVIVSLPQKLSEAQTIFSKTGGLHAAALFEPNGKLEVLREDVGRHNAVDKLIGSQLLAGKVPIRDRICAVSGRLGFEIVQKSLAAKIPVVVAVGAPSSLAVDLAREFGMTLIGFVRDSNFNIYSGPERVVLAEREVKAEPSAPI